MILDTKGKNLFLACPNIFMVGLKTGEPLVPLSELKALKAKVRDLERLLGRKTIG